MFYCRLEFFRHKVGILVSKVVDSETVEHRDVIIVGAGPTGGRTATHLASLGHRVLMLEEHTEIGRPFQCAGLVTPKALLSARESSSSCHVCKIYLFVVCAS